MSTIYPLTEEMLNDTHYLQEHIYANLQQHYYWSKSFSSSFYIAQAKQGFIAVTDCFEGEEILLPEIQKAYALLHLEKLHKSRKAKKSIRNNSLTLEVDTNIVEISQHLSRAYTDNWLTPKYAKMLEDTLGQDENFSVMTAYIESEGEIVAGEIGYAIGETYTSLSGFSLKSRHAQNYGTAQLILLGEYLQAKGFLLWNLGETTMSYKMALGAEIYSRQAFLEEWFEASQRPAIIKTSL